jgi:hypothetical protein
MFRRETIIALRARHQAYRIASDIAHPHVNVPPPPEPPLPTNIEPSYEPGFVRHGQRAEAVYVILVSIALVLTFVTLVVVLHNLSH